MDTNFINELYNEEIKSRNAFNEGLLAFLKKLEEKDKEKK